MNTEPNEAHMLLLADHECDHGSLPHEQDRTCACWDTYDLQCRLDALRAGRAPLPMSDGQAIVHAIRLRTGGMPYATITQVMAVYHGQFWSENRWRRACRARGVAPIRRGFEKAAAA